MDSISLNEDLHYQPISVHFSHFQQNSLELIGLTKTKDILQFLKYGRLIETDYCSLDVLQYLQENIEYIRFYDSQDNQFGGLVNILSFIIFFPLLENLLNNHLLMKKMKLFVFIMEKFIIIWILAHINLMVNV